MSDDLLMEATTPPPKPATPKRQPVAIDMPFRPMPRGLGALAREMRKASPPTTPDEA